MYITWIFFVLPAFHLLRWLQRASWETLINRLIYRTLGAVGISQLCKLYLSVGLPNVGVIPYIRETLGVGVKKLLKCHQSQKSRHYTTRWVGNRAFRNWRSNDVGWFSDSAHMITVCYAVLANTLRYIYSSACSQHLTLQKIHYMFSPLLKLIWLTNESGIHHWKTSGKPPSFSHRTPTTVGRIIEQMRIAL